VSLKTYTSLENGDKLEGPAVAWNAMMHGELDKAHQLQTASANGVNLALLLAASDNAPSTWADQVLTQAPDSKWSEDMLWYGLALATRQHQDTAPYLNALTASIDESSKPILDFYQQVQSGNLPAAEASLNGVSLRARGQAYAIATVIKGNAVPTTWRNGGKRLLFGAERPYFD